MATELQHKRSILDSATVLSLNSSWIVIGTRSVREAILAMNAESPNTDRAAVALDIQYKQNEDGSYDFSKPISIVPTKWDEWISLVVLPHHDFVKTPNKIIRAPTVVISPNFSKMVFKKFRPSKKVLYDRDKKRCQYSGELLSLASASIDHVISKDEWRRRNLPGSPDNFKNMVICKKEINFKKANKPLSETGLKLLKQPEEPIPVAVSALVTECRHADWNIFIHKKMKS